jgi:hypothetical protein
METERELGYDDERDFDLEDEEFDELEFDDPDAEVPDLAPDPHERPF